MIGIIVSFYYLKYSVYGKHLNGSPERLDALGVQTQEPYFGAAREPHDPCGGTQFRPNSRLTKAIDPACAPIDRCII